MIYLLGWGSDDSQAINKFFDIVTIKFGIFSGGISF